MMTAPELLRAAENEYALPLLFHTLGKERLRPDGRQLAMARQQLAANALDGGALMRQLPVLIEALAVEGVPVVLLKGAALQLTVYRPGLRPMGDIDFLIRPADREATASVLTSLGYRCVTAPGTLAPDIPWEATWRKDGDPHLWVEPHWAFWPLSPGRDAAALAEMWRRAQPVSVDGLSARVLCHEDALLHLCVHLPLHEHQRWLVPLCDIRALLQQRAGDWDWGALVERARALGVAPFLDYGLSLAARAIDAPVATELLRGLRRQANRPTACLVRSALESTPTRARTLMLQLLSERGSAARLRLLIRWVFFPKDYIVMVYRVRHTQLFWWFYPWRALRGIRLGIEAAVAMAGATRVRTRAVRRPDPPQP